MAPVTVFVKTILLMSIEIFLFHESYLLLPNQVLLIVTEVSKMLVPYQHP